MLNLGEFLSELALLMVVNHGHSADDVLRRTAPFILDKAIPYEIPDSFRPVGVTLLRNEDVELVQQVVRYGYSEPHKIGHLDIPLTILKIGSEIASVKDSRRIVYTH